MPILRVLDLNQIQAASAGQPDTTNGLSAETRQICLALLTNAKKAYAWEPKLEQAERETAWALVDQAIAEINTGTV